MKKMLLPLILCLGTLISPAQHSPKSVCTEVTNGTTKYDMQTNKSCQNRIYRFSDGTIGATWMYSQLTSFDDRGTGYSYYNGTNWGAAPTARIENIKSGWPSYAPWGAGGELVVSHKSGTAALTLLKRATKGAGSWTQTDIPSPSGNPGMVWPRVVTSGANHNNLHLIALTQPVSNGGTVYQGLDGAILYNRSLDGGSTWVGWQLLPGMTSATYLRFMADTYSWAEPHGDTLCFAVGDSWNDEFIMKSTNNGTTWTKTVLWNCPYNLWGGTTTVAEYYCPDGSSAVALDNFGKAHVVFGRQRASGDNAGLKYWFPFTNGLIYWNENQSPLPQSLDSALLAASGNFIGGVQDPQVWASGGTDLPYYRLSLSSMPSISIDNYNRVYVVYSAVTSLTDLSGYMLRHVYGRASMNAGATWCAFTTEITGGLPYVMYECVYPSLSPTSSADNLYLLYQCDDFAGSYVVSLSGGASYQGQTAITVNDMRTMTLAKSTLNCGGVAPVVDFSANNVNPGPNQTVIFSDLSANSPTSWQWSFAPSAVVYVDATNANSQNPHVQFTGVGYFSVTLTATNSYGSGSLTKTNYIHVTIQPPVANFTANQTNISTGQQVQFTDLSTGAPTSWSWSFPGGTPSSSTLQTPPPVAYNTPGQFDVVLTVTNSGGSNTNTKIHYITVANPAVPPVSDFTANQTTVTAGGQVQFTDLSTGIPTTWAWSFPGGSPSSSSLQTPPPITYSSTGQFDVTLIVTNAAGSSTNTKVHYITVTNVVVPPVANFTASQTNIPAGGQVLFTDLSTGSPTTWSWSFPGGTPPASNLQSPPAVTYSTAGQYDVTLQVTNAAGTSTNTKSQYIVVSVAGAPVANFTANLTNIPVGGQVQFYDLSSGSPLTWQWSFPGGSPPAYYQQNPPPVTYNAAGQYDVILTVVNQGGSSTNTKVKYIRVGNTGMEEGEPFAVTVFPNPAGERITVKAGERITALHLVDRLGVTRMLATPDQQEYAFPLVGLPEGVYVLRVDCGPLSAFQKVVVAR